MARSALRLSKSRYTSGLQCHKQLWWKVHEPDAPELVSGPERQAIFDQGSDVGRVARDHVPGGVLIDLPHRAISQRVADTEAALRQGAPAIYEASFTADDTFVAVDILERVPGGFRAIEVKSTATVKPEHLSDVAVQVHVLRRSGLAVAGAQLMHLNRECAYPDLSDLFTRVDVSAQVESLLGGVAGEIRAQLAVLAGPLPKVAIGPHCTSPYDCPFLARCWPPLPRHHVRTLYGLGQRAAELEAQGYATVGELPDGLGLRAPAERQRRAVREGRVIVEAGLGAALAALPRPLAVLDFETVMPAIPVWNGCHPFDPVPAQFSCHAEDGAGGWKHDHWLAEGPEDPRADLVRRVESACRGAAAILAYSSSYETRCLELIAAARPDLADAARGLAARVVDALPLVRDFVYHPEFGGSFSLKAVLPALVPELGYQGLDVAEGGAASRLIAGMLFEGQPDDLFERQALREALEEYCTLDTWGMVKLLEKLGELSRLEPGD